MGSLWGFADPGQPWGEPPAWPPRSLGQTSPKKQIIRGGTLRELGRGGGDAAGDGWTPLEGLGVKLASPPPGRRAEVEGKGQLTARQAPLGDNFECQTVWQTSAKKVGTAMRGKGGQGKQEGGQLCQQRGDGEGTGRESNGML